MHLRIFRLRPGSTYHGVARNHESGTITTYHQIGIATDATGEVVALTGVALSPKNADSLDYLVLTDLDTGIVTDLRLHTAAERGELSRAREALEQGADVNLRAGQGATALHWASDRGQIEVAEFLLEHGAEIDCADELGWTPIFLAVQGGHTALAHMLHARGASLEATINGKHVRLPLESEPDPDLLAAAEGADLDGMRAAIAAGARVDCRTDDGWTPLLTVATGPPELAEFLLSSGADPNAVSDRGYSALMRSAGHGNIAVVRLLLAAGADPSLRDCDGKTARRLASEMGQSACANLLG